VAFVDKVGMKRNAYARGLIHAINSDLLAAYVVMACEDSRVALHLRSLGVEPDSSRDLGFAVLRHLRLLGLESCPGDTQADIGVRRSKVLKAAHARTEADKTSTDPLTRYLYTRRSGLAQCLLSNTESPNDRRVKHGAR
jgi:hypothetical protein